MIFCQVIIFLIVLLISVVSGQIVNYDLNAAGYPAPKLHPLQDQHVLNAGDNFTLRCSGKFELEWVFPTIGNTEGDPAMMDRVEIIDDVIPGDNPRPHVSHLHLSNLVKIQLTHLLLAIFKTAKLNIF